MKFYVILIIFFGTSLFTNGMNSDLAKNLNELSQKLKQLNQQLIVLHKTETHSPIVKEFFELYKKEIFVKFDPSYYANLLLTASDKDVEIIYNTINQLNSAGAEIFAFDIGISLMLLKPDMFESIGFAIKLENPLWALAQYPFESNIIVGGDDKGQLFAFDIDTRKILNKWNSRKIAIRSIAFHPDKKIAALGTIWKNDNLELFSFGSLIEIFDNPIIITGHNDWITDVKFNRNGSVLASISDDTTIKLWNSAANDWLDQAKNKTLQPASILRGHNGYGFTVSFNANNNYLASGAFDGTVKLWNVSNIQNPVLMQTFIASGLQERKNFSSEYEISTALFHPSDPNILVLALYKSKQIVFHDINKNKTIKILRHDFENIDALAFDQSASKLAAKSSQENTLFVWNIVDDKKIGQFIGNVKHFCPILLYNSGKQLITGFNYGKDKANGILAVFNIIDFPEGLLKYNLNILRQKRQRK